MRHFNIIVCVDKCMGISKDGKIPWVLPGDLANFRKITKTAAPNRRNVIIMGRKTFESIPNHVLPLDNRITIVITSSAEKILHADHICSDLNAALKCASGISNADEIFICGGSRLYSEAILHPCASAAYINVLDTDYKCDNKVQHFDIIINERDGWVQFGSHHGHNVYGRTNSHELAYVNLMQNIIDSGSNRPSRTGIRTFSKFAQRLEYPLTDSTGRKILPLFTTKKVSYKLVLSELIWMLNGGTDTKFLHQHNNHIWDGNSSREFLSQRQLDNYEEGELGPIYGYQWRYFNAPYMTNKEFASFGTQDPHEVRKAIARSQSEDQIENVINSILKDPFGRRHIVTAWNPAQINEMALPACHFTFMFYVDSESPHINVPKYLSCHLIMRSNDMFLGHPFNVASYATLTHMIALCTNLVASQLVITMNDCHVYANHVDQVETQSERTPYGFPTLEFSDELKKKSSDGSLRIEDFTVDNVKVVGYVSHRAISARMAV